MISLRIYVFVRSGMLLLSHWAPRMRVGSKTRGIRDAYPFPAADIATQFQSLIFFLSKTFLYMLTDIWLSFYSTHLTFDFSKAEISSKYFWIFIFLKNFLFITAENYIFLYKNYYKIIMKSCNMQICNRQHYCVVKIIQAKNKYNTNVFAYQICHMVFSIFYGFSSADTE